MSVDPTNKPAFPAKPAPMGINAGAVAIESDRAIAEAQGRLALAKRFPRDEVRARAKIMESCSRISLADGATYKYSRGGKPVSGPSIRLAEELARCWGNISYGMYELSRGDGYSEMEVYARDDESNTETKQRFTVRHIRDRADGGAVLSTERDVYEIAANMASRRMRARILALIPADIKKDAVDKCRETMAGNADEPLQDRINKAVAFFAKHGISIERLEAYAGCAVTQMTAEHLVDLREILSSVKDGEAKMADFFPSQGIDGDKPKPGDRMRGIVNAKREEQAASEPAPAGDEGDAPI